MEPSEYPAYITYNKYEGSVSFYIFYQSREISDSEKIHKEAPTFASYVSTFEEAVVRAEVVDELPENPYNDHLDCTVYLNHHTASLWERGTSRPIQIENAVRAHLAAEMALSRFVHMADIRAGR